MQPVHGPHRLAFAATDPESPATMAPIRHFQPQRGIWER
jgi:hypothetical protein